MLTKIQLKWDPSVLVNLLQEVLYQIQNGKPKLITYVSKRLPKAAWNYSITELDMWFSYKYCQFCTSIKE